MMPADVSMQASRLEASDLETYAPEYRVTVDGQVLDPTTKGDILDISVVLQKGEPAGFTLNVNDWDDQKIATKYSSTTTFDPGRTIAIELGFADRIVHVISGTITSLSVRFPESGPPTLTVGGQDKLREIGKRKPTANEKKHWTNVPDWKVVEEVAGRLKLGAHVDKAGPTQKLIIIKNQDYASFLLERAAKIDFEVYVDHDPKLPKQEQTLFFVQRRDGRGGESPKKFAFQWGRNLISFSPRLSTSEQVRSVKVRAWDPEAKKAIVFTADRSHLPKPAAGDNSGTAKATAQSNDLIIDRVFKSLDEAREYAISELMRRSNSFSTGTAKIVGLPQLRPGMLADLSGLGARFDYDSYQVTKVTHTLGSGGYLTEFDVENPTGGKVTANSNPAKTQR